MEVLTIGPRHTLTQNVVYALPARAVYVFADTACQVSHDSSFTSSQAISANTPTVGAGAFIRCTTGAAVVSCKAL